MVGEGLGGKRREREWHHSAVSGIGIDRLHEDVGGGFLFFFDALVVLFLGGGRGGEAQVLAFLLLGMA